MADLKTPSGAINLVLESGKSITVVAGTGATGFVSVLNGQRVDGKDQLAANTTRTFGPYDGNRIVRILPQTGALTYQIGGTVASLPLLNPAVVSQDGKTVSGVGTKPNTSIDVYNADTGVALGTTKSLIDGTWSLTLPTALSTTDRVGYDATVVGPTTVVAAVVGLPGKITTLLLGATTSTSQELDWDAPTDGETPTGYLVEYKGQSDSVYTTFPTAGLATAAVVTGLASNTSYSFRVTALSAAGPGITSAIVTKVTAPPVAATDVGPASASFTQGQTQTFATFTGLAGRTVTGITPADGRVVVATNGTALAPGLTAMNADTPVNFTVKLSDGSTYVLPITASAAVPGAPVYRAGADRCSKPSLAIKNDSTGLTGTNGGFTQCQARSGHDVTGPTGRWAEISVDNLAAGEAGATKVMDGYSAMNLSLGISFRSGADAAVAPGYAEDLGNGATGATRVRSVLVGANGKLYADCSLALPAGQLAPNKGDRMYVSLRVETATAWAYIPLSAFVNTDSNEVCEFGTSAAPISDKTLASKSAWKSVANVYTANRSPFPITSIKFLTTLPEDVAPMIDGNSIDGIGDNHTPSPTATDGAHRGGLQMILGSEYPTLNVSRNGMALFYYLRGDAEANYNLQKLVYDSIDNGVNTIILCNLTADLRAGRTSAQVIADIKNYVGKAKARAGAGRTMRVIVNTPTLLQEASQAASVNTNRNEVIAYLRSAQAITDGIAGIIDSAKAMSDPADPTKWYTGDPVGSLPLPPDRVHPIHAVQIRNFEVNVAPARALLNSGFPNRSQYAGPLIGAYKGANQPDHSETELMIGQPTDVLLDFYAQSSWAEMQNSVSFIHAGVAATNKQCVLSVPLCMDGSTLAQVAAGQFDPFFQKIIDDLTAKGLKPKVKAIRLAWEMNGGWYYYCVPAQGTMADFVAAYRRIAKMFRAAGLAIHWCPNVGYGQNPTPAYYPGDDVVDYVGLDVYAKRFAATKAGFATDDVKMWTLDMLGYGKTYVEGAVNYALQWLGEFALGHGKPIIIGEFGTGNVPSEPGNGGQDSSYFMQQIWLWALANQADTMIIWDYPATDYFGRMSRSSSITGIVPPDVPTNVFRNVGTIGPWDEKPKAASQMRRNVLGTPDIVTVSLGATGVDSQALSWGVPSTGVPLAGYTVEYRKKTDSAWTVAKSGIVASPTGATTLSYTVTGLVPQTDYVFRVSAQSARGHGGYGVSAVTTAVASTSPTVSVPANAVGNEGSGTTIPITLSAASANSVTVSYATTNGTASAGTDYTGTSGSVTFASGETQKNVVIPILADAVTDANETFTFTISGLTSAGPVQLGNDTTVVTITDVAASGTPSWYNWSALAADFDASDPANVTTTTTGQTPNTVTAWKNKVASRGDLSPITAAQRPSFNTQTWSPYSGAAALNMSMLEFGAVDPTTGAVNTAAAGTQTQAYLEASSATALSALVNGTDASATVLFVGRTTATTFQQLFGWSKSVNSTNVALVAARRSGTSSVKVQATTADTAANALLNPNIPANTLFALVLAKSGTTVSMWLVLAGGSATQISTKNINEAPADITAALADMLFGVGTTRDANNALAAGLSGQVGHLVVSGARQTDAEIQAALTELANKWKFGLVA